MSKSKRLQEIETRREKAMAKSEIGYTCFRGGKVSYSKKIGYCQILSENLINYLRDCDYKGTVLLEIFEPFLENKVSSSILTSLMINAVLEISNYGNKNKEYIHYDDVLLKYFGSIEYAKIQYIDDELNPNKYGVCFDPSNFFYL